MLHAPSSSFGCNHDQPDDQVCLISHQEISSGRFEGGLSIKLPGEKL